MSYAGFGFAVAALFVLAGCGAASSDEASTVDPEATAIDAEAAEFDLSGVSFDVRRDPG